jgi:hypothetical protein
MTKKIEFVPSEARKMRKVDLEIENFNLKYPVGTPGKLFKDSGENVDTKVRGEAYLMCGQSMAFFEGVSGCYKTDRFKARRDGAPK